jgi:hypothetical protein
MDVFLGILLFFIVVYYAMKLFLRYVLPWLLARFVKKQQDKFSQQHVYNEEKKEGEINIKSKTRGKTKDDKSFGEYIDFEDLDDK